MTRRRRVSRRTRRKRACLYEMKRIVVKGKDWHCNLAVTDVRREGDVVFAYRDGEFAGMWDLGAVNCLWVSECETKTIF